MAKICPNCGKQNKSTAKFCENCGISINKIQSTQEGIKDWWNNQSSNSKYGISLIGFCCVIVIIGLLIVGISVMSSSDSTSTSSSADATQQSTDTQTTHDSDTVSQSTSEGGIKILSSSAHRDNIGDYLISGEVQNNYDTEVSYVEIVGTGYDSDGNVVTSHTTYADLDTIQPGGKSPFECYLDDPDNEIVKYELQAQA